MGAPATDHLQTTPKFAFNAHQVIIALEMVSSVLGLLQDALTALPLAPAPYASEVAPLLTAPAPIVDQTALNADQPDAMFAPQDSVRQSKDSVSSAHLTAPAAQALSIAKFALRVTEE